MLMKLFTKQMRKNKLYQSPEPKSNIVTFKKKMKEKDKG